MTALAASAEPGFFTELNARRYDRKAIALTLSGGGYRATLFHTGAIMRLNELGLLSRLSMVSSVSGGSITAGFLAKNWDMLGFDKPGDVASPEAMRAALVDPVLKLTAKTLDVWGGLKGLLPGVSAGNAVADMYDEAFDGKMLADIVNRPRFVFNATNLQTGGLFKFTKHYVLDSRAVYCEDHGARLADAVAASAGFPPVLSPYRLNLRGRGAQRPSWIQRGSAFDDIRLRRRPVLADGGIYDNLGLESVWTRCGVVIASYSGFNLDPKPQNFDLLDNFFKPWNASQLMTVMNTFLAGSVDWRERTLIALFQHVLEDGLPERAGAYWTAQTDPTGYESRRPGVSAPWAEEWEKKKRGLPNFFDVALNSPTRLKGLQPEGQIPVIRAGYAFADLGARTDLLPDAPAPIAPPVV